ncbi:hypothetical protein RD792_006924 [Penstemon davidsonii]|uniref:ENTH domain-containing protein n=1 Tax=Penstemon davidsonii TaxID=160366 RepID=A0ABR0D503_9LAMI|nr:hypothetical protein RD792_006924 [Penstemon davidsonii]
MPSKLKKAIAAVKDQTSIGLAKVSTNTSSNLEVAVLKATTHDDIPIDDKYVNEVLQLVSSNKHHASACARAIGKRIGRTRNWVVALKSLMLVLRIFQDGDPYFPREVLHAMKRGAKILNLSSFRDDSNSSPWDFTSFVRTFALYLDERLECFLTGKLQRRCTHRGKESSIYNRSKSMSARRPNEPVRDMKPTMLLDKISYWQRLLERAIATRPTGAAKTNRLVQISLYAIVQESFELYKDISDGLALLLDSFFHLQYQNCVSAFQTCVKAAKQFEELSAFYSLCKSIGVGRSSEYPSVQTVSEELVETLQEFLKDQSSFPSTAKPANRPLLLPAPSVGSRSGRHDSYGGQSEFSITTDGYSEQTSEFGSQCTSLEDLISATETGTRSRSISIDLETYSESQRDDAFRMSETGSSRSLPVSNSIADLMSMGDWSEQDEKEFQQVPQEQQQKELFLESSGSKNWELVLAETLSTPTASSSQSLSNNNTNSFDAFQELTPKAEENHSAVGSNSNNGWELAIFEAAPPIIPNAAIISNNHYNPFLQDSVEILPAVSNVKSDEVSMPTFQAVPTFSVQNPNQSSFPVQNENDPFAAFSDEGMMSSSSNNQQNLLQEQELWLQNQNKIIAKQSFDIK